MTVRPVGDVAIQRSQPDCMDNQFAEQRRDVDGTAPRRQRNNDTRCEIQSLHKHRPAHLDAMLDTRRNPDSPIGRHDPFALRGMHPHHSFAGINQLMPVMRVWRDHERARMPNGEATDYDPVLDNFSQLCGHLTFFRHYVAFYRETSGDSTGYDIAGPRVFPF